MTPITVPPIPEPSNANIRRFKSTLQAICSCATTVRKNFRLSNIQFKDDTAMATDSYKLLVLESHQFKKPVEPEHYNAYEFRMLLHSLPVEEAKEHCKQEKNPPINYEQLFHAHKSREKICFDVQLLIDTLKVFKKHGDKQIILSLNKKPLGEVMITANESHEVKEQRDSRVKGLIVPVKLHSY